MTNQNIVPFFSKEKKEINDKKHKKEKGEGVFSLDGNIQWSLLELYS